jgi:hypothetical protein
MTRRAVTAVVLTAAISAAPACAMKPRVYRYKIVSGDGGESVLYGERIQVRGACVELLLRGRVDTIMCGIRYITELPEAAEPAPEPEVEPEPDPVRAPKGVTTAAAEVGR